MKLIKRLLKWTLLFFATALMLLIVAGLAFRLFGPDPHKPNGQLIEIDGHQLHIHSAGEKNAKPTVIIEAGGGLATEYYHWLNEDLKDSLRVVRYDRAGIGYSESSNNSFSSEIVARELHLLLEKAGESPPYILAGHSLGGLYIRTFTELYPDEVAGIVLIDSTHPEQVERFNAAPKSSFKFKTAVWGLNVAVFFADMGVIGLFESFSKPIISGDGLPDEINARTKDFLLNGKTIKAYKEEVKNYHATLNRAKKAIDFDSIPIRVFTAIEINRESYRERGIDPDNYLKELIEAQGEFTQLSTNGKQFLIDGNHQTIFTKRENANIISSEILQLAVD